MNCRQVGVCRCGGGDCGNPRMDGTDQVVETGSRLGEVGGQRPFERRTRDLVYTHSQVRSEICSSYCAAKTDGWLFFHRNDKIIAAAPLSGYLSIPAYIPYHMWHEADPRKSAVVLASLSSYRHELLVPNMLGTPILQQHGQDDDNVPVYHSRRMHQLIGEADWASQYAEIPGKGHWWEGVMTEEAVSEFLVHHLAKSPVIPELPTRFSLVVASPADTGPRGGIVVDQLEEPDRYVQQSVVLRALFRN